MISSQPGTSKRRNEDSDEDEPNRKQIIIIQSDDSEMEDSEDESEGELDELFEETECAGEWTRSDFKQFEGEVFKIPSQGSEPFNFFELLLDDDFFGMIVNETNDYAESKKGSQWKNVTVTEFRKFLGLLLHMYNIKCKHIQDHWSTNRLFNFICFSRHMSLDRFRNILHYLHFSSNDEDCNPLSTVQPIIDYFNNKMKAVYYPHQELSIDKTTVVWKGRLAIRQYISGKEHTYGTKLYVLTENSGISLRIKVYSGKDNINATGDEAEGAGHLLEDFLKQEHEEKPLKPLIFHRYSDCTIGITEKDQISNYTCSRRNFKWYIKLWINLVETLLLNSFLLYSKYVPVSRKLNFYNFRIDIIDNLLFEIRQEHRLEMLTRGENNKIKRKRCRQCFINNIRKDTNYYCGACKGNPGLCTPKCFKEFHQRKK